jgi:hypothetical protein
MAPNVGFTQIELETLSLCYNDILTLLITLESALQREKIKP